MKIILNPLYALELRYEAFQIQANMTFSKFKHSIATVTLKNVAQRYILQ